MSFYQPYLRGSPQNNFTRGGVIVILSYVFFKQLLNAPIWSTEHLHHPNEQPPMSQTANWSGQGKKLTSYPCTCAGCTRTAFPFILGCCKGHSADFGKIWVFPKPGVHRGTPKSWILIGFSIINHPFWGFSPLFLEPPIWLPTNLQDLVPTKKKHLKVGDGDTYHGLKQPQPPSHTNQIVETGYPPWN